MNPAWQVRRPELLATLKQELEKSYPMLRFVERGGQVFVKGAFPILDGGESLDWYQVEIEFPTDYPESLPVVRETGRRIPRLRDRHVNPADGTLCVGIPDSFYMDGTAKAPFLTFLQGPVRTFLLGNSIVEQDHPWPFGEWDHGGKGVLEYYAQLFALGDPALVALLLICAFKPNIKGHVACPCKSGRIFRRCHSAVVREVEGKVPSAVLKRSCAALLQEIHDSGTKISPDLLLARHNCREVLT